MKICFDHLINDVNVSKIKRGFRQFLFHEIPPSGCKNIDENQGLSRTDVEIQGFPVLENEIFKFKYFPGISRTVRTL